MKIAYYIYWLDDIESGVIKKISDQINYWISKKHTVKLFIYTKHKSDFENSFKLKKSSLNIDIEMITFNTKLNQFLNSYKVNKKIKKFNPDLIYMRESKFSPGIYKLTKKNITITEINSITKNESHKNSLSNIYNRNTLSLKFKHINAFIAVTNEIKNDYSLTQFSKPTFVIGNGIDLQKIKSVQNSNNKKVNLVFIGSDGQKWHGIDKIIELAKHKTDWLFHIIGISKPKDSLNNVNFYGKLNRKEYESIFEFSDIAIGTLSLYKKKLNEACPLKTREYLAYGLPIIIGYKDVDFTNQTNFICELPNKESNLIDNLSQIEEFINKWKGRRIQRDYIQHLDVSIKEKYRLSIFEEIIGNEN